MFPPTGFHVEFDLSKPSGHRVKSLNILCTKCRVPHYEPVQDETVYKVVVPSYIVTGGDGFSMIKNETIKHNSGETCRYSQGFVWDVHYGSIYLNISSLVIFISSQGIWTSQSCPTTSHRGRKFIRLLKDASRSTTQLLDCEDKLLRWFYFHWVCSGLCVGPCKTQSTQKTQEDREEFLTRLFL